MADTLEQIAEHLQKAIEWAESSGQRSQSAEIPGLKADLKASILKRSKRDMDLAREHTTHVLAALQSLARERDAAQAWAREQSMEEREQRKRAETAEQSRDALQQRVESLSQSLFAALERCQAAVQEPRGQEDR
jgi:hypothetical protein